MPSQGISPNVIPMTNATDYREAVAAEVRAAMGRKRMTQVALAEKVGMSRPAMSDRLACRRPFDLDQLVGIADTLDLDLADLLDAPTEAKGAVA